eukprot:Polyplicarium_translucidae@DN2577_c0_g1_i1.p1
MDADTLEIRCARCERLIQLTDFVGTSRGPGSLASFLAVTAGLTPHGSDPPSDDAEGPSPPGLCTGCLKRVLKAVEDDDAALRVSNEFLKRASQTPAKTDSFKDVHSAERCKAERHRLFEELRELKTESLELQNERIQIESDLERLAGAETALIADAVAYRTAAMERAEESARVAALSDYASRHLDRLGRMNVINDTFHIWQDGKIATINGFRLGRLVSMSVSWDEINMALGQVCYLLCVLTRKHGIVLQAYTLLPKGSASAILRKSDNSIFELRGSEGGLTRLFNGRRFDLALVGLLACLQEIIAFIEATPPYCIEGECLEGLSVRLQISGDDKWTKAMKFFLLNLKWALAELEATSTKLHH